MAHYQHFMKSSLNMLATFAVILLTGQTLSHSLHCGYIYKINILCNTRAATVFIRALTQPL